MPYVLFGQQLHSSFRLPGMNPARGDRLPVLALELTTTAALERAWSGAKGPPEWQGRLGDGCDLTIELGRAGDLLFTYGDRARFRLHSERRRLDCAPAREGLDWCRALIGKIIPSIAVMRGYEALHAAAVDSPDGVVAIAGPSGAGKSTLAAELMRRGWPLFADDELTLARHQQTIRAHPGAPHMNLALDHPGSLDPRELGMTLAIFGKERWLVPHRRTEHTRPVRALCLLERRPDLSPGARAVPANPLLLAPHMLGLSTAAERRRSRFHLYADLVDHVALVRLNGDLHSTPAELVDLLESALTPEPARAGVA
jgi:hypothetical protein